MCSPPITIRPGVLRVWVPYVASAQTREQKGSLCFRATGGIRSPHRWHATRAFGLRVCLCVAIVVISNQAKMRGPSA